MTSEKIRKGDLVIVSGLSELEGKACIIIKGPYPTVLISEKSGLTFSEETMAADLMCNGRIYSKIKTTFLFKIMNILNDRL